MDRQRVAAGAPWGAAIGYSRAVRTGGFIFVSGTSASGPNGALHPGQPGKQAEVILERIGAALRELGASLDDVVETRVYLTDISRWEEVARAHGTAFAKALPATALVEVSRLIAPDLMVEISAVAKIAEG
jgi:enamine deaminase RidA (YjgF/YER057c/UK114 family)